MMCAPDGSLTSAGREALMDIAKYCRAADAPTRHANGAIDVHATMEAIGMQKVYKRLCALLSLDDLAAMRLAMQPLPTDEDLI